MYEVLNVLSREPKHVTKPHVMRENGFIPGVVYGGSRGSVPVKIHFQELFRLLQNTNTNLLELKLDGQKKILVNMEDVQRDPIGTKILHVTFHKLKRGQETTITLPFNFVGEAKGVEAGGVVLTQLNEFPVVGIPGDMPEDIEVDISNLDINENITLAQVKLSAKLRFDTDNLEQAIVTCSPPKKEPVIEEGETPEEKVVPETETNEG
ncbi:MAG: 50S ribosomal protein L25 [Bacteriovoracia bacterium]